MSTIVCSFKPTLVPKHQVQKIPDLKAIESLLLSMTYEKPFHALPMKPFSDERTGKDTLSGIPNEAVAEHIGGGTAETPFLPINNRVRNNAARRLPQDILGLTVLNFESRWKFKSKRNDILIEKRHSRFYRIRHAHFIHPHQKQFG